MGALSTAGVLLLIVWILWIENYVLRKAMDGQLYHYGFLSMLNVCRLALGVVISAFAETRTLGAAVFVSFAFLILMRSNWRLQPCRFALINRLRSAVLGIASILALSVLGFQLQNRASFAVFLCFSFAFCFLF